MLDVILVSSLEKVGAADKEAPLKKEFSLSGFLGETVSFQVAFRGNQKGARVRAAAMVQGADNCDAGLRVRLRQVLPVMCRCSCREEGADEDYLFTDTRMAPDLLRELEETGAELTGGWQALWVDVLPEEGCRGGEYEICISLTEEGEKEPAECRMNVRVIDRQLPELNIPHTEWFHCDGIVDYYGVDAFSDEFWRIFKNFLDVYVKRGGNTMYVPVMTPALDTGEGLERTTIQLAGVELTEEGYRFDFTDLERFLDICLSGGIKYFEICHLFTQWGALAAPKVVATVNGEKKRIFGLDTPSDDPVYLKFLGELLPALKELLSKRGLMENTFFHISDEPNLSSVKYQRAQGAVRPLLEGCTIMEAVSEYEYYAKGLVDIPVCATDFIEPFLEKRPPVLWSYYCCAQAKEVPNRFISMPSWRNRIYGVLLYWHHIDGFLHWGFNFYNSILSRKKINPYETVDADGGFPAGDPFMVYPGKNGIPEESIRLMVQDEAIGDYRALCLLEEKIGREQVMDLIRQEAGMELSFRQYPRNAEFVLGLREKVNGLLEKA